MTGKDQRKLRIYLKQGTKLYGFYWIEFLLNGSFSFGIRANINWLEFGSTIHRKGEFVDKEETVTTGNADITELNRPHVTFHPPRLNQEAGIAHFVDSNGKFVDEWSINWFPVGKPQVLIIVDSGISGILPVETKIKKGGETGVLPIDLEHLRMHLAIFPRNTTINAVHDPSALVNIRGHSSEYILSARVYKNTPCKMGVYMATDVFEPNPI